jgi:hypothetical protein
MEFQLRPDPDANDAEPAPRSTAARGDDSFSISSQPVVEDTAREIDADEPATLPLSHHTQTVWLMPRDPQSLFACWDVDWRAAFQDETPTERKVHLRLLRDDGSEETAMAVEPMSGNCHVPVAGPGEFYTAELGFYQPAGTWNLVATSAAVAMPSADINESDEAEFATIPLHLSFQRMIDAFRLTHHESASITQMLADLRERVTSTTGETNAISSEEREIARALDHAATTAPQPAAKQPAAPDLWARMEADRVLGFGATSPRAGFGGNSSRA